MFVGVKRQGWLQASGDLSTQLLVRMKVTSNLKKDKHFPKNEGIGAGSGGGQLPPP